MKQANQSFHYVNGEGQELFVPVGKVLPDAHPDVVGHENLFDDLGNDGSGMVAPAKAAKRAAKAAS